MAMLLFDTEYLRMVQDTVTMNGMLIGTWLTPYSWVSFQMTLSYLGWLSENATAELLVLCDHSTQADLVI